MNPSDFLHVTAKSLKDDSKEANLRTSASRSYYAIYHIIKSELEKENISLGNNHGVFTNCFFYPGTSPEFREIAQNIGSLYEERRKADYELGIACRQSNAKTAYDLAVGIIQKFSVRYKGEDKATVVAIIKKGLKARKR